MKKFMIQSITLVVVILLAFYLTFNSMGQFSLSNIFSNPSTNPQGSSNSSLLQTTSDIKQVKMGENLINVEVADNSTARAKGLSGRDGLDPDSGMLFVFPTKDIYKFYMKDMKFNLDFVFIADSKIITIIENVKSPNDPKALPNTLPLYFPNMPVNMVLELNAGYVAKHKIKNTDIIELIKN